MVNPSSNEKARQPRSRVSALQIQFRSVNRRMVLTATSPASSKTLSQRPTLLSRGRLACSAEQALSAGGSRDRLASLALHASNVKPAFPRMELTGPRSRHGSLLVASRAGGVAELHGATFRAEVALTHASESLCCQARASIERPVRALICSASSRLSQTLPRSRRESVETVVPKSRAQSSRVRRPRHLRSGDIRPKLHVLQAVRKS